MAIEQNTQQDVMKIETEVTQLYDDMQTNSLTPLWRIEESLMAVQPQPKAIPWLWKWEMLHEIAARSGRLVPIHRGGDRRAIALSNPGLNGQPYAVPSLWAAVQWLNGHEVAPAHRHTSQAIRFIINGSGSWSTVEGDRVYLERGDFVLTAPWLWHDHGSKADEPAVWMDGLDIPLNNYLDASFFEPYPQKEQEVTEVINGVRFEWKQGDFFVIPSWAVHEHHNLSQDKRAILFSMHDTPLLTMLNKYRHQEYTQNGGHQEVSGTFTGK